MSIPGLTIIGESINDSVPSTHKLYEANDIEGIMALAKTQDEGGAGWIDVNVGTRGVDFMAEMVRGVQNVTSKPLSIDTPDPEMAAAGLRAYDPAKAGGALPILNSISAARMEMFDLYAGQPFIPILLTCERVESGESRPNRTGEESYRTAKYLLESAMERGIPREHCIFDPGIAPIGSDTDGINRMVMECLRLMHDDPDFAGAHRSVGLSNFTVMLPPKRADGSPVKGPLESAFLTVAMPLGLDFIIGSVKRKYEILDEGHDALVCLREVLQMEGYDGIMRLTEFYS